MDDSLDELSTPPNLQDDNGPVDGHRCQRLGPTALVRQFRFAKARLADLVCSTGRASPHGHPRPSLLNV